MMDNNQRKSYSEDSLCCFQAKGKAQFSNLWEVWLLSTWFQLICGNKCFSKSITIKDWNFGGSEYDLVAGKWNNGRGKR